VLLAGGRRGRCSWRRAWCSWRRSGGWLLPVGLWLVPACPCSLAGCSLARAGGWGRPCLRGPWLPGWQRWTPGRGVPHYRVRNVGGPVDGPPIIQISRSRPNPGTRPVVPVSYPRFSGTDRILVIPYHTRIRGSIFV
jgi:hypothetical protein